MFQFDYAIRIYQESDLVAVVEILKGIEFAYRPNSNKNATHSHVASFYFDGEYRDHIKEVLYGGVIAHKIEPIQ